MNENSSRLQTLNSTTFVIFSILTGNMSNNDDIALQEETFKYLSVSETPGLR